MQNPKQRKDGCISTGKQDLIGESPFILFTSDESRDNGNRREVVVEGSKSFLRVLAMNGRGKSRGDVKIL